MTGRPRGMAVAEDDTGEDIGAVGRGEREGTVAAPNAALRQRAGHPPTADVAVAHRIVATLSAQHAAIACNDARCANESRIVARSGEVRSGES